MQRRAIYEDIFVTVRKKNNRGQKKNMALFYGKKRKMTRKNTKKITGKKRN